MRTPSPPLRCDASLIPQYTDIPKETSGLLGPEHGFTSEDTYNGEVRQRVKGARFRMRTRGNR